MVLTWLCGIANAELAISTNKKVTEEMMRTIPAHVNPAILEPDVSIELPTLTMYFEDDAWEAAKQLSSEKSFKVKNNLPKLFNLSVKTMNTLKLRNQLDYICQKCDQRIGDTSDNEPSVDCNSCQQWLYWKCENLKTDPKVSVYKCTQCRSTLLK